MVKKDTYLVYGLVTGGLITAATIIYSFTKVKGTTGIVPDFAFAAGILLNAVAFSKANNGYVTFNEVFKSCFKASLIVAAMVVLWGIIFVLINPAQLQEAMITAKQHVMQKKHLTTLDKKTQDSLNETASYIKIIVPVSVGIGVLIMGAFFSLIGASVVKKKGAFPPAEI